jgi:hypothetical protein
MQEWNVIITVRDFKKACDLLAAFGRVKRSDFYNTLTMNVEDIHQFLEILHINSSDNIEYLNPVSRLIPVTHTFSFQSPVEFESKLKEKALTWVNELEGKGFYVSKRNSSSMVFCWKNSKRPVYPDTLPLKIPMLLLLLKRLQTGQGFPSGPESNCRDIPL